MSKRPLERTNDASKARASSHAFKRQFAHVEGNWPSHVYIVIDKQRELMVFSQACIKHFLNQNKTEENEINIVENDDSCLHVSLSRPFVLRHHQIQPFLRILHKSLLTCPVLPISCEVYAEYTMLKNDTNTRSFVSIPLEDRLKSLETLVTRGVNVALQEMRQPLYYDNPKFHISVASYAMKESNTQEPMTVSEANQSDTSSCSSGTRTASSTTDSAGQYHVYAVDRNVVSDVRKLLKQSDSGDISSEGDDSDSDTELSTGTPAQYYGSTLLDLDVIECKIGNKKYRFDKIRGFLEC
mmetsp:Transcript_23235/g.39365  ORF Transcript_23235/g.39365 Transcript_23235/m.39365 type:complete len:297 (+) Transcript_23235:115-1005(+)